MRLLRPGERMHLGPITFTPPATGSFYTWLYVRNNATTLDEVLAIPTASPAASSRT